MDLVGKEKHMKKIFKIAAVVVACCSIMAPTMAQSTSISGRIASGGQLLTSPVVKKDTASYTPASAYFSRLYNTDSQKRPLALCVRTTDMQAVSPVISAYGTGNYVISYNNNQGWNGSYYVLRVATHTASNGYAEITANFQP